MDKNVITLNRNESNAIKGLLIFLIVLGHNAVFTKSIPSSFEYLYTFHVQTFFILPFLYGTKSKSLIDSFSKNFVRLYYPFLLFFTLLSILWLFAQGRIADANSVSDLDLSYSGKVLYFISAIFTGNYFLIDYFSGFQFLWFLPVMFSMNILRETLEERKYVQRIILIIGIASYIMFFVFMYKKPYADDVNFRLMLFSPFAILQGCGAYFMGKMCVDIMRNKHNKVTIPLLSILFIIASIIYIVIACSGFLTNEILWFLRFIMPFLFINFLYSIKERLAVSKILKNLGIYSFPIYIIHPVLCTVVFMICQRLSCVSVVSSLVVQAVVVIVSYYTSILLFKITPLRKRIFPRSWDEVCLNSFQK